MRISRLVVISLVVASCGAGPATVEEPDLTVTSTSSTVPATTSTLPASTSTSTTATTTTSTTTSTTVPATTTTTTAQPSAACAAEPGTEIHADATSQETITGDVDGDGFDDTITGYLRAGPEAYLHVELAGGWGTSIRVDTLTPYGADSRYSVPARVVAMSGEPMIVSMISGISVGNLYGFFAIRDCSLEAVLADGEIPDIWTGGGAAHDDWFTCHREEVVMLQLGFDDPTTDERVYTSGGGLVHRYNSPSFEPSREIVPRLTFPISAEDAKAVYPPCVR